MGYSTSFEGVFHISPSLSQDQINYINKFSETRRMMRSESVVSSFPDPLRDAVNLPVGDYGEFYVNSKGLAGQNADRSIIDFNSPPPSQPSLWCDWEVSDDGKCLQWNESEKFYNYDDWLKYMIRNFFIPWKVELNGEVMWRGEEDDDVGVIVVEKNVVNIFSGQDFDKYIKAKNSKESLQDNLKVNIDSNLFPNKKYKI